MVNPMVNYMLFKFLDFFLVILLHTILLRKKSLYKRQKPQDYEEAILCREEKRRQEAKKFHSYSAHGHVHSFTSLHSCVHFFSHEVGFTWFMVSLHDLISLHISHSRVVKRQRICVWFTTVTNLY